MTLDMARVLCMTGLPQALLPLRARKLFFFRLRHPSRTFLERHPAAALSTEAAPPKAAAGGASRHQDNAWPGLQAWRSAVTDERLVWGDKGASVVEAAQQSPEDGILGESLAHCGRQVLLTADAREKALITHKAWRAYKSGRLRIGTADAPGAPSRPPKPELVPPKQIPSAKHSPLPLNVYMLHNLAHIELNAIDLAWDTVVRFSGLGLPEDFYADFARVADDEARHLLWCLQRMNELGFDYGCMPAHNLLWEGAEMSAGDLLARLAIVPMSQEARGLDAGKRLAEKMVGWGDNRTAAIVHQIALEERNHVAVGVTWFQAICDATGTDPGPAFRSLLLEMCPDLLKGPFNHEERGVAGLPRRWYDTAEWPEGQRAAVEALQAAAKQQRQQAKQQQQQQGKRGGDAEAQAQVQEAAAEQEAALESGAGAGSLQAAVEGEAAAAGDGGRVCIPPGLQQNEEQVRQLQQRLATLLDLELKMT